MAADENRRDDRTRSERRDPARMVGREPPLIEGAAEDVTPAEAAEPMRSADDSSPVSESTPEAIEDAVPTSAASTTAAEVHAEDPAPDRAASAQPAFTERPSEIESTAARGWSNFATAIAVAVVIMAGAIIYLLYQYLGGPDTSGQIAGLNSRLTALETRPGPDTSGLAKQAAAAQDAAGAAKAVASAAQAAAAKAQSDLAELDKRVAALPAPQPAPPPAPDLQPQVADLQQSLTELKKSVADLQASVAAVPRPDVNRIEARFGDLDGRLGALQGIVSGIPHVDLGPLTGKVDALETRLKPIEAETQAAQSPERVAERRAAPVAVTAQAIVDAIAAGQAFPQEFRALQVLGTDPAKLAPLQVVAANGAPSLHDLRADLAEVQGRIIGQGTPAPSGSYMDRMMAGASSLVQVRPLGSVVGDTPAAIVSRIDGAIAADDLHAALADWQKLPEASRTASKSLPERIKLRLDAETAARAIAANAIEALAAPRG